MTTQKKNNSAMKKLIPATSMLLVSSVMLASSTYAWFTMSREVEVQNIKMTATVPEDLQISLGEITDGTESVSLAKSTGVLALTSNVVNPPANQDDDDPFDWSNIADISAYYAFGKLIPASSTTGANIYFTPDANGVGKTVKSTAVAYTAVTGSTAGSDTTWGNGGQSATSHTYTSTEKSDATTHSWATTGDNVYTTASAWNTTNSDGYYIDIPIWLRTSSTTAPSLYVTGFVKADTNPASAASDADDLYQAVRVAILNSDYTAASNIIDLNNGANYPATQAAITSVIDSTNCNTNFSLSGTNALKQAGPIAAGSYEAIGTANKGATSFGTLQAKGTTDNSASATAQYGPSKQFVIRVWLEGEDVNCWNANAGQDWSISLKFSTETLAPGTGG